MGDGRMTATPDALGPARAAVGAGVVAALLLPVVVLWDGATRGDGYDTTVHWISLLSLGSRGALGRAALLVPGVCFVAAAVGMGRLARACRGSVGHCPQLAFAWAIGCMGTAMVVAFAFPIDPVPSYPVGSPSSPMTATGFLHTLAGCAVVVSAAVACGVGAWVVRTWWAFAGSILVCATVVWRMGRTVVDASDHDGIWEAADAGLNQRISVFSALAWIAVLCLVVVRRDVAGRGSARTP